MAKKPAATKAAVEALFQATFDHEKETKNKVRFKEDVAEGKPEVIGTIYLGKNFMPNASRITVTGLPGTAESATDHEGNTIAFSFRNETKNKLRFEEVVADGEIAVIETLYVSKASFDGDVPEYLVVKIEG